jgi:hypothetical protein
MSPSIQMSVYLTTFNMNMRSSKLSDQELQAWFAPAFEYGGTQPDLIAVGIQELLPLELARGFGFQRVHTRLERY